MNDKAKQVAVAMWKALTEDVLYKGKWVPLVDAPERLVRRKLAEVARKVLGG